MGKESPAVAAVFPRRLVQEAARTAGGWVYETDGRANPDGFIPIDVIIRAWKISPAGVPTGEVWENPQYCPE
jgi:hypothetical protein